MRKIFLFMMAAFILASCDNLKKKDKTSEEDDTEETVKKKKALDEDEESTEDETPKKKKKTVADDELTTTTDDDGESDNNTSGENTWTSTDKSGFMKTCVAGATKDFGEEKAQEYCDCMLNKIQEAYPRASDAIELQRNQNKMTQLARTCLFK